MSGLLKKLGIKFKDKDSSSSSIAKDRLRFILLHDRVNLPPQVMAKMREELIAVVSKYLDCDSGGLRMEIEQGEDLSMLVANVPIARARRASHS